MHESRTRGVVSVRLAKVVHNSRLNPLRDYGYAETAGGSVATTVAAASRYRPTVIDFHARFRVSPAKTKRTAHRDVAETMGNFA